MLDYLSLTFEILSDEDEYFILLNISQAVARYLKPSGLNVNRECTGPCSILTQSCHHHHDVLLLVAQVPNVVAFQNERAGRVLVVWLDLERGQVCLHNLQGAQLLGGVLRDDPDLADREPPYLHGESRIPY